jgi:hypothetical protein
LRKRTSHIIDGAGKPNDRTRVESIRQQIEEAISD